MKPEIQAINLEMPMTICLDNRVTDCTKVKLAVNTRLFVLRGILVNVHNIHVYYFSYNYKHHFAFCDDLNCPIYSWLITNSHTSESFIRLFLELLSLAILFCFLTNLMSRFPPWQMEVNGFPFVVSLLQVRKLSPVLRHALNRFEECYPFCSSRTLIVLHSLEAMKSKNIRLFYLIYFF